MILNTMLLIILQFSTLLDIALYTYFFSAYLNSTLFQIVLNVFAAKLYYNELKSENFWSSEWRIQNLCLHYFNSL